MPNYTKGLLQILQEAGSLQRKMHHSVVNCLHIGLAMLRQKGGALQLALQSVGQNQAGCQQRLESQIEAALNKIPSVSPVPQNIQYDMSLTAALHVAQDAAQEGGDSFVGVPHLLLGLMEDKNFVKCVEGAGLERYELLKTVKQSLKGKKIDSEDAEDAYEALQKYCVNLTQKARDGKIDPCIGRDKEIRQLTEILSRRIKNNPVLTGPAGVGKTQIVEGLARRIIQNDVPESLTDCQIYAVDLNALIAGASYRGQFEERLKGVLDEAKNSEGKCVLFFDELHTLFGSGGSEGRGDAANLLKPALSRGELRCIGATTEEEYRKYVSKDKAFERRFSNIQVEEPDVEDTTSILRGVADVYAAHHGVAIEDEALIAAAKLAARYLRPIGRRNPDAALDLIDEACAALRVSLDSQPEIIDQLNRKKTRLQIEISSLQREFKNSPKDEIKVRIDDLQKEIQEIDNQIQPALKQYNKERNLIEQIANNKAKLTSYQERLEQHEARHEIDQASEVKYMIVDVKERLKSLQNQLDAERKNSTTAGLLRNTITKDDIALQVSKKTGIPAARLSTSERERALHLADELGQRVIGQETAVNAVADAIVRQRAHIQRTQQPLGSFFFLGSTGCGKTRLAQELALSLFDDSNAIVRIDLSEFMEEHSVARLIGAPPGYVGHDEGGQLTEAVFRRRYCVVLLDEVEKAHPKVLQILLQVLDEGRLTDGKGNLVDFTNTVLILTSNLGSQLLLEAAAKGNFEAGKKQALELLKRKMLPELLNRFDDIIFFNPLNKANLTKIFDIQFKELANRVMAEYNMEVVASNDVKNAAIEQCDILFGARPLRRFIEQKIGTALAKMLLSGQKRYTAGGFDISINDGKMKDDKKIIQIQLAK